MRLAARDGAQRGHENGGTRKHLILTGVVDT
jgi:hypothetical protein